MEIKRIYPDLTELMEHYKGNVKLDAIYLSGIITQLIPGSFAKIGKANGYLNVYAMKYGDIKSYIGYFVI